MATYADVMNPNSVEYHTIQATAAQAITIAEIYLSSNGLQLNPRITMQSNTHLPATILIPSTVALSPPVAIQHEQLGFDNTGEQILSETRASQCGYVVSTSAFRQDGNLVKFILVWVFFNPSGILTQT